MEGFLRFHLNGLRLMKTLRSVDRPDRSSRTLRAQCRVLVTMVCLFCSLPAAVAQDDYTDLNIFGYMQACAAYMKGSSGGPTSTTFLLQQLNVMGAKQFDSQFSMFMNLQFTNSYSSELKWGSFNLEEAWAKYSNGPGFNIKAGLLTPTFNAMHQVKNKTPLLPYVFRPFVYESVMSEIVDLELFLPMRANVEVYGALPVGNMKVEYAAYLGNSDSRFSSSGGTPFLVSGMDSSTFKLVGARLGLSSNWFRFGVSATADKENQKPMGLGILQRNRFGADLSIRVGNVTLEGEGIMVRTPLGDQGKAMLAMIRRMQPLVGQDLNRFFYYGTLLWDMTDEFFGYGSYSYLQNNENVVMADGLKSISAGGGWRPHERVVVKAQYVWIKSSNPLYRTELGNTLIAISVLF